MLHHVSLEVREDAVDAEVAFWAALGYREVPTATPALAARSRWVQDSGPSARQIHLLFEDEPTVPRSAHVAIVRADYDATLARLREAGYEVSERRAYWGSPRAFARSPAGHRVEVMQYPPAV
jgi:catechol 2,3-dioxygenase-like lactoylglutathione lyase family enzyme